MSRSLAAASLLAWLTILAPATGEGMCLSSPLESRVRIASLVFAGTVVRVERVDSGHGNGTRYYFDHVRYVKGSGPDSGLFVTLADIFQEDRVWFGAGRRYVVLAHGGEQGLMPMLCGTLDPFEVVAGSEISSHVVCGGHGTLAFLDARHVVLVSPFAWAPPIPVYGVGSKGRVIRKTQPPARTMEDEIRLSDSMVERAQREPLQGTATPQFARMIAIWPHQDPGTRVTEDELLRWLAAIVAKQATLGADSTGAR